MIEEVATTPEAMVLDTLRNLPTLARKDPDQADALGIFYVVLKLRTGSRAYPGRVCDHADDEDISVRLVAREDGEFSADVSFGRQYG